MTTDEAIKILEYPVFKWSLEWDDREDGLDYCDAIQLAIEALKEKKDREVNEVLSYEDMVKMVGEPVFVVQTKYYYRDEDGMVLAEYYSYCSHEDAPINWQIVMSDYFRPFFVLANSLSFEPEHYGEYWIAYKYPPVESKGCE